MNIIGIAIENKLHIIASCEQKHKQKYIAKFQKLYFWH